MEKPPDGTFAEIPRRNFWKNPKREFVEESPEEVSEAIPSEIYWKNPWRELLEESQEKTTELICKKKPLKEIEFD